MPDRRQGERRNGVPKKLSVTLTTFIMICITCFVIILSIILCRVFYVNGYNKGYNTGYSDYYTTSVYEDSEYYDLDETDDEVEDDTTDDTTNNTVDNT